MSFSIKECTDSPKNRHLQRQAVLHSFNKKEDKTQTMLAHIDSFASLPLYKTPPSVVKTRKPFNPFNRNLMERLESTTFSPTVFKNVISPGEVLSSEFRWTIEHVSRTNPVNIEDYVHHDDIDTVDNETEQSAQEAIERYFSKVEIPSPWDAPRHCSSPLSETPEIPCKSKVYKSISSVSTGDNKHFQVSSSPCLTVNVGTQTCWSFPPVLPEHVEALLKPYLVPITNEFETEEGNLSASTLCRKLNFSKGHDSEQSESDDESMSCNKFSLDGGFCSPVSRCLTSTPLPMSILSPPDVSPILASTNNNQSKLTARLNFTSNNNGNNNEKEENDEIASVMVTSVCDNNSIKGNKHLHNTLMKNDSNQQTAESIMSPDTGYNTQSSNDKTGWGGAIGVSEMEITDNISWNDPVVYACSTPTKGKPFLVC